MFYIDGVSLSKIKEELKTNLSGKKINKITKNTETSLSIYFGKTELVFSCNSSFPICYITNSKEGVLESSAGLAANMKKHLLNAMLVDIVQLGFDRILNFKFSKINELGEIKNYNIYFEIMGKYSNFVFTDGENKIIDLLKRFSLEENRLRAMFPGITYEQPIIEKKISPLELTEDEFVKFSQEGTLLKNVEGIGKLLLQNIDSFEKFKNILDGKLTPKLFLNSKRIVLATVLDILPKSKYDEVLEFNSFNEIVNYYISSENLSSSFDSLRSQLMDNIIKRIKKDEKILTVLAKEKEEKSDFEKYKELGDILASCIYSVKKGMSFVETYDFYNDTMIKIPLEPQYTPQENLERIYKKYNKLKRGLEANARRVIEITQDLDYLNSIKLFIETSNDINNLKVIYDELVSQGYIKLNSKKGKNKKQYKEIGYGVVEGENYRIFFGRNNTENDNLTFKVADRNDTWLHAKNIPGSHVIIKCDNLTDEILFKGAEIAAFYSKGSVGDKINVDYTLKRHINKPKGGKPGFVTYVNEKNITVIKPDKI